ncbi:MAG: 7-alpha-hydroxysteroid dehydrogenase [Paracoccaceae bacterium]|jgi:7-alpha-hydroxysteroid dehydrogenase
MAANLDGKSVIVTGAAHGVGREAARRFAAAGARVVLADREEADLRTVAQQIVDDGGQAVAFPCDLTASLTASNLIAATLDAWDRVDILVNGARTVMSGGMLETDSDALSEMFDINVRATFRLSQAAARRMISQAEEDDKTAGNIGSIVNITSISARRTLPELLHYSVSCAALDQLTRSMAVALAPYHVRVNAVALGSVMTRNLREALRDKADLRARLTAVTPLGRVGEAGEAADAVLFLASDKASFITGQILAVDGGRTMLDPLATPAL